MRHGGNGRFKLYLSMSNLDNSYGSHIYLQHYQSNLGLVYKSNLKQHVDNVLNNHIAPTDSLFSSTIMQVGDDFQSDVECEYPVVCRDDFWLEDPGCYQKLSVDFPLGGMGMTLSVNSHNSYTFISKLIGLYIGDVVIKVGCEYVTDYHEIKNMIPCISRPLPMIFARKITNTSPTPDICVGTGTSTGTGTDTGTDINSVEDFQILLILWNLQPPPGVPLPLLPLPLGSWIHPLPVEIARNLPGLSSKRVHCSLPLSAMKMTL